MSLTVNGMNQINGMNQSAGVTINSKTTAAGSDFVDPSVGAAPKTGPAGGAPKMPVSFYTEVMNSKIARTLSTEGTEFLNVLTETLEKESGIKKTVLPRTNCHLFHDGKTAVGIIFEEHLTVQRNMEPLTRYTSQAYKEAADLFPTISTINIVLCSSTDYGRVQKWIVYIKQALIYGLNGSLSFDIENISQSGLFRVITNKHVVDSVVNDMCVHGVLPYYQYGLVLEMYEERDVPRDRFDMRVQNDANWTPILCIPAYTTFLTKNEFGGGDLKYIPQIHIAEPLCVLPHTKMLPLVMSLAVQYFLSNGMWKDYFNQYDTKSPNIGSLWIDPETGEPAFVNNVREREQFIGARCETPTIVLDIINGRASIPGVNLLSTQEWQKWFLGQFSEFFKDSRFLDSPRVVDVPYFEYTGVVKYEGQSYDSRAFDYFKILTACSGQRDILDKFTSLPYQPDVKLNALAAMNFSVQSLYDAAICVFDPEVLVMVASSVGARLNVLNTGDVVSRRTDFGPIDYTSTRLREALNRNNGNFFTCGPIRSTYNPFIPGSASNVWNR